MATPINIIPGSLISGSVTLADTQTFTSSFTNAGAAPQTLISLQNTQPSTGNADGYQQWSPFQEFIGHGWSYLLSVGTTNISRSAGSAPWTITVTTSPAHAYSSGISIYVYIGTLDGYFVQGTYGPITVTGANTFTYVTSIGASSGGNAVSENINLVIADATGIDQTIKVKYGMRPKAGVSLAQSTGAVVMGSPEMVFERTSYPNNGAYGEWFKFSAINSIYGVPFGQTGGVSLQTVQVDGVSPGSFLTLAPGQISFHDDNGCGLITGPTNTIPNATGSMNVYGGGLLPAITQLGLGVGSPVSPFYDIAGVRGNFGNIGLGDPASTRWGEQLTAQPGWHSTQSTYISYGVSSVGGQARFAAIGTVSGATVASTNGASTTYNYFIVAVDRNGYVSTPVLAATSIGPTTRSATAFNTISWSISAIGAVRYDIYLTSVSQANWLGSTTGTSFKDTGAARYTSPGSGVMATPSMLTALWSSQGGAGGIINTYAVYAVDADNHVIGSTSANASFNNGAAPNNYINVAWTPIGGTAYYLVARGNTSKIIGVAAQQGVQQAGGTTTSTGMSKTSGTANVTLTYANGHGLRVGDSVTISAITDTTHFAAGTFTVTSVTSATVFVYNDAGSTTFSGTTQGTFLGPFIITSSFTDYGYTQRVIGNALRNNTADVSIDGYVTAGDTISAGNFIINTAADTSLPPQAYTAVLGGIGFSNSWTNFSGNHTCGYYKDVTGRVYLAGMAGGGTLNSTVFTLPAGFRPNSQLQIPSACYNGSTVTLSMINIQSTGVVSQGSGAGNTWITFNGISFLAEQ